MLKSTLHGLGLTVLGGLLAAPALGQGWVTFQNETATRVIAANGKFAADPEEKDYAYGDLDLDGDIDLVVVRKGGFTQYLPKPNFLFMNEGVKEGLAFNGIFVDRTNEFASAADDGGQGFNDSTNDRNVAVGDVNGDGWPDVITAVALASGQPKSKSHPRVYINLGDDGNGNWLGLRFEVNRVGTMTTPPNACGVSLGDVTGDGFPEIYISDYFNSAGDKLLINDGNGFFTDETLVRMSSGFASSGFGTASAIVDVNNDGFNDLLKSENGPFKTTYNNISNEGFFNKQTTPSSGSHYNMSTTDLNNDGKIDIIISDDGSDRYLLNDGTNPDGTTKFISKTYSFQSGGDDGIAGNSASGDLNNDGWNDVIIADVDVDIPGCGRRAHIYRNLGNAPVVTMQEQGSVIPNNMLQGTHDIAIFDINNDGWKDVIVGRCSSTGIWMNVPPAGLVFSYPNGLPGFVNPGEATPLTLHLETIGDAQVIDSSVKLTVAVNGLNTQTLDMIALGNHDYEASLPAANCTDVVSYYLTAQLSNNSTFRDPPSAPAQTYTTVAAYGITQQFRDELEGDVSEWSTSSSQTGVGAWEIAEPIPTSVAGKFAAPNSDATSAFDAVKAFVTANGKSGTLASAYDVDLGPFYLVSPTFDLEGTDGIITFAAWFFCEDQGTPEGDQLDIELSNDGGATWTPALSIAGTNSLWKNFSLVAGDILPTTANMKVRFKVQDLPNNSITEAGIDNFEVDNYDCGAAACVGDVDGSGSVDGADLGSLLAAWGTNDAGADFDGNGIVDGADLGALLAAWGPCN